MHAVTYGDAILVRQKHANNPRILAEELQHVRQNASGLVNEMTEAQLEIQAREIVIENARKYGISNDEIIEMQREISIITERGFY